MAVAMGQGGAPQHDMGVGGIGTRTRSRSTGPDTQEEDSRDSGTDTLAGSGTTGGTTGNGSDGTRSRSLSSQLDGQRQPGRSVGQRDHMSRAGKGPGDPLTTQGAPAQTDHWQDSGTDTSSIIRDLEPATEPAGPRPLPT